MHYYNKPLLYVRNIMTFPLNWHLLLVLILIGVVSFILLYSRIENFFIFYPQSSFNETPYDLGLDHREASFDTEDGVMLHGWFFPRSPHDPVILFCHGNAGNISHRLDNIRLLVQHHIQVFIFDYRGYGKSTGSPSEQGIYHDGLAAYDYLVDHEGVSPSRLVIFGRSLGAAVAIEIAAKRPISALIIESAFTSTKDMAREIPLFFLLSPFLPAHYNNLGKIAGIGVPKLVIHGDKDTIVPFSMGNKLFAAATMPKRFYRIRGANHNDTYIIGGEHYIKTFTAFVRNPIHHIH